jgi:polysaccharide export outer membrane protein
VTKSLRETFLIAALASLGLSGCATRNANSVAQGVAAYDAIPSKAQGVQPGAIQPGDRLFIRVLGEPDLTSDQYWVDGSGKVQVPLAGEFVVAGKTTSELRKEITKNLGARYIRDPQVAVSIVDHSKSSVTVEGEVQHAGRFEASPGLTLLGALALAQSTTKDSKLDEVVVYRELSGQRMAARFDISQIRSGKASDPQIISGDVVVVGRSSIKGTWHDFLQAAPLFNLFYILR